MNAVSDLMLSAATFFAESILPVLGRWPHNKTGNDRHATRKRIEFLFIPG